MSVLVDSCCSLVTPPAAAGRDDSAGSDPEPVGVGALLTVVSDILAVFWKQKIRITSKKN